MALWAVPAIAQGVGAVASYFSARKNRTPRFEDTAQGRYLKKTSKQGVYTPYQQATVTAKAARGASAIANTQQSNMRGYLAARGMQNSVVGARALSEPQNNVQEITANAAENIALQNEQSKLAAKEAYLAGTDQARGIRQQEKSAATANLVGGLAGAAGAAVGGYYQNRARIIGEQYEADKYQRETDKTAADIRESDARAGYYEAQGKAALQPTTQKAVPVSTFIQQNIQSLDLDNIDQTAKQIIQAVPSYDYAEVLEYLRQIAAERMFGGAQ